MKPSILLTRKLPSSVMARLEASCDVERFDGDGSAVPRRTDCAGGRQGGARVPHHRQRRSGGDRRPATRCASSPMSAVGYNNIDVAAARERGIVVTNTPDVLTDATADFTLALILAITRRLGEGERLVRRGDWKGWAFDSAPRHAAAAAGSSASSGFGPHRAGGGGARGRVRDDRGPRTSADRRRHAARSAALDVRRGVAACPVDARRPGT